MRKTRSQTLHPPVVGHHGRRRQGREGPALGSERGSKKKPTRGKVATGAVSRLRDPVFEFAKSDP
jgi:hypothetical protein